MSIGLGVLLLIHLTAGSLTSNVLFQEVTEYHNKTYNKAVYAFQVVSKIYNAFRQWFFTVTFCDFTYFENRILKYTESSYGYPVLLLSGCPDTNRTRIRPKINKHGKTAYVITGKEISLENSEYVVDALIRTGVFKPRSAVIFIINDPIEIDSYFFYTLRNHFQFLWSRSITNSVVMLMWKGELKTYAYNSFKDAIIDITDVNNINYLLSHQYDNLLGHVLRLSVYKRISAYDEVDSLYCKTPLADTVMRILNATCKPLIPRDGNTVGDLLANGTATGVTADLMDAYTDLELNSRILKNSYYGYIDTSYPFMRDELCFLIKSADKQSTFMTTVRLISVTILTILIFNVILMTLTTILARNVESNIWHMKQRRPIGNILMDVMKCFLRQTVDIKNGGPVYNFLVLLIILYSLIVNCILDGIITSAITYPRFRSEVNTLDELYRSNLTLGVHNRHISIFNSSLTDSSRERLKNKIEITNDQKIREVIDKRKFQYALLLRKTDALVIATKPKHIENGRPLFQVMPECPIPCFIVFGFRYGSPYLRKIENVLHHLNQAGIIDYWLKSEEYKIDKFLFNAQSKFLKPLSLTNLQTVFTVWIFGLVLSTLLFLFELLVYWYRKTFMISM